MHADDGGNVSIGSHSLTVEPVNCLFHCQVFLVVVIIWLKAQISMLTHLARAKKGPLSLQELATVTTQRESSELFGFIFYPKTSVISVTVPDAYVSHPHELGNVKDEVMR